MNKATAGFAGAEDLKTLRAHRALARAAQGVLDLVMPIRAGGDVPPLFCAHPMVGLSWCYMTMLPHPGRQLPVIRPAGTRTAAARAASSDHA